MRTIVISILFFVLGFSSVFAQEDGKFRAGADIGCLFPHEGAFGLLGAIELKYNLKKNMDVGLKPEFASYIKDKNSHGRLFSFSISYDYYFHTTGKRSSPLVGVGLGYYFCEVSDVNILSNFNNPTCFIRAGYEIGKFRMSLAYNLIRKPSEMNPNDRNRDYISLTVGVYFGGGKWK